MKIKAKYQGIFYIICAAFFFSLMSFFVRMAGDVPTLQKCFFRNIVAVFVTGVMLARSEEKFKVKKGSGILLFFRALFGTIGIVANFYAIDHLNLADSNILNKLSPFFAILMSYFLLKEIPKKTDLVAVVIAFIGAVFVVKPTMDMNNFPALMGLLGGFCAGTAYTFVRKLGKHGERGLITVMVFSVASCSIGIPYMIMDYHPMTTAQLICLLMAGVCGSGGQFTITAAYTKAPAKEISVFDYTQVIFAAILGFLFLNQIPDVYSFIGYAVILAAAVCRWYYGLKQED